MPAAAAAAEECDDEEEEEVNIRLESKEEEAINAGDAMEQQQRLEPNAATESLLPPLVA